MKPLIDELYTRPYEFNFFQAVRLLARIHPDRKPIGFNFAPNEEVARVRPLASLSFPPSSLCHLLPGSRQRPPRLTAAFVGLYGPNAVLPEHYTVLLLRLLREAIVDEESEKSIPLRDWLDIFNHRLFSLFYRAWEKYRFLEPFTRFAVTRFPGLRSGVSPSLSDSGGASGGRTMIRSEARQKKAEPADPFTGALFSLVGIAPEPLQHRIQVFTQYVDRPLDDSTDLSSYRDTWAKIDDLVLAHYAGLLVQRPRNVVGLQNVLADIFEVPFVVQQFTGQWLEIEPDRRSRLEDGRGNRLGVDCVSGERVWDAQSKFRIIVGPLDYDAFVEFLPDRKRSKRRKTFFLLSQLVQFYVGPEFDFEILLTLKGDQAPDCAMDSESAAPGPCLGWNTWLPDDSRPDELTDASFDGDADPNLPMELAAGL